MENNGGKELEFSKKMYLCAQLLGAKSDLLSAIGSWRKDTSDEDTFLLLDDWITETIIEQQQSLNYIIKAHNI